MNIMGSCVSFQIKIQILAFHTDVCTAPNSDSVFGCVDTALAATR